MKRLVGREEVTLVVRRGRWNMRLQKGFRFVLFGYVWLKDGGFFSVWNVRELSTAEVSGWVS